jgi:hypothetical protein
MDLVAGKKGVLAGLALWWWLTRMLAAVLTGVFDPPPAALVVASVVIAHRSARDRISAYRET